MCRCSNIITNSRGVPVLTTTGISVTEESVDFSLGMRDIPAMGYITLNISNAIPTGTTGTLPVTFRLNGAKRNLTFFGGNNVTAADIVGSGIMLVFYDFFSGIFQVASSFATTT